MTEIINRNEFDKSYLLIRKSVSEENYIFNMLTQNVIPGIPDCKIRYLDENVYLAFDVTGKKTLEKIYKDRKIDFSDMTELFYGIRKIMYSANNFLLDREGFLLTPQYMFADLDTGELSCLYYMQNTSTEERYRPLADFLLDRVDHKDEHAVNIAYHFYKISKEEYFSFESFIGFMEKESLLEQAQKQKKEQSEKEPACILNENHLVEEEDTRKQEKRNFSNKGKIWIAGFLFLTGAGLVSGYFFVPFLKKYPMYILVPGITLMVVAILLAVQYVMERYLNGEKDLYKEPEEPVSVEDYFDDIADDITVFFDQDEFMVLKWKEGHFSREYILDKFPVTVGKMQGSVQMLIDDMSVSRLHAAFRKKETAIFLQDLDSTNGTYVNKKQLSPGEETIIKRGDEIQFGKIIVNVV